MKLKNILLAVLSPLLLGALSSCSDSFLDQTPYSSYGKETLGDEKGVESLLKGLHYTYGQIWTWSDQQGWLSCWHIGTDIASPGGVQGVEIPFYHYEELNPESGAAAYMWEKLYQIINSANIAVETIGEDGSLAKKAEALFFRGYAYNLLATLYGGVPITLSSTTSAKTDFTRASLDEVNKVVIDDLTFASENLPDLEDLVSQSRVSKYMAMQALGEAYLRIGANKEAENILSSIINSGKFQLITERYGKKLGQNGDYYSDMFAFGNQRRSEGNKEAIWVFQLEHGSNLPGGHSGAPQHRRIFVPAYHNVPGMTYEDSDSLGGRGNGRLRPSNWVKYQLYEEGDIRNSQNNFRRTMYYNVPNWSATFGLDKNGLRVPADSESAVKKITLKTGDKVIPSAGDTLEAMFPYITKWNAFEPSDPWGWTCVKDFPLMRLGETYLLRAEARFKQGDKQGAADDINILRKRAFEEYPEKGKVNAADIDLNFILDERARELIFEENRRVTLMRTGTLIERAKLNKEKTIKGEITGLTETHLLLPIPLNEILRNKDAVLEQNPGYTK